MKKIIQIAALFLFAVPLAACNGDDPSDPGEVETVDDENCGSGSGKNGKPCQ